MGASSAGISVTETSAAKHSAVLPFDDPSRSRRLVKVAAWLGGVVLAVLILNLLGVDVRDWLSSVWDALTVAFAVVVVVWAFGWSGGKLLVQQSYVGAKDKVSDQKQHRAANKAAKRDAD